MAISWLYPTTNPLPAKVHFIAVLTAWKFNSSPLKSYIPKRKGSFSNHHFSGAMLNFGGVEGNSHEQSLGFDCL